MDLTYRDVITGLLIVAVALLFWNALILRDIASRVKEFYPTYRERREGPQ